MVGIVGMMAIGTEKRHTDDSNESVVYNRASDHNRVASSRGRVGTIP